MAGSVAVVSNLVWFAIVDLRTLIICASHKAGHSAERSAMNSQSPYVEDTIASCISAATKPHGGTELELIRHCRLGLCGSRRIRSRQARIDCQDRVKIRGRDGTAVVEQTKSRNSVEGMRCDAIVSDAA